MSDVNNKKLCFRDLVNEVVSQKKEEPKDNIYINIEKARKEWEEAKNIFENVSEPELVDYAIYNVVAAEKKFTYLLKQIKNDNTN
ncbi:DUF2508 family protein [Sedimentibacter sp. MB31-C6]|uniref:DUF2508 family protein n=1 Tax=Sedimentibacter sp. MB31-C6 TaxID=3109366 RepID=UPI002DDC913A|nr:DUF2508 family protein [Sedimentibacter sp. MB36-C1]WSI05270.1 DUF2508 family protein [Sedimentibacter sp. MB36-C1]